MTAFLLIARKNGSSTARRQRGFATLEAARRALARWREDGFTVWWIYGPRGGGNTRPLLEHAAEPPLTANSQ